MVHTEPPVRRSLQGKADESSPGVLPRPGPSAPGPRARASPGRRHRRRPRPGPARIGPLAAEPSRAPPRPWGAPDGDAGRIQWNPLSEWMDLL